MVSPVTDPALLAQLNATDPAPVTDPALLAQLNGTPEQPAQQPPPLSEQFNAGIAHGASRIVRGLGTLLPDTAVQYLEQKGIVPTAEDVKTLGRMSDNAAGTVGSIAMDAASLGALPFGAAASVFPRLAAARGVAPALARTADVTATQGTLGALTNEDRAAGATAGAAGGFVGNTALPVFRTVGGGLSHALGLSTGAGANAIKQAFRDAPGFVENMRGHVEPAEVVNQARQGLQNMRTAMSQRYATAKGGWAGDTTQLDLKPVAKAFDDAAKKFSFQGTPQPGVENVQQQVAQVLGHWNTQAAQNPAFRTVEGLDALKRHLNDLMPDYSNPTGRAFVSEVVGKVKDTIIQQAPKYKAAMEDYWRSSNELDEIAKSLSLGDKASIDTALRKLQSLTRNNVNTNYGQRLNLAQQLEQQGGADILPAVAGQALNSWTPRGIQGAVAGGAGGFGVLSGALSLPALVGGAIVGSPRIVGETARATGQIVRDPRTQATLDALRRFVPAATRNLDNNDQQ